MNLPFVIQYEPNESFPFQFTITVKQGAASFTAFIDADEAAKDAMYDAEKQFGRLRLVIIRWIIREVEAQLRDGVIDSNVWKKPFDPVKLDVDRVVELAAQKECAYQIRQARDLFCLATDLKFDTSAALVPGGKVQAPTSKRYAERAICLAPIYCAPYSLTQLSGSRSSILLLHRTLL